MGGARHGDRKTSGRKAARDGCKTPPPVRVSPGRATAKSKRTLGRHETGRGKTLGLHACPGASTGCAWKSVCHICRVLVGMNLDRQGRVPGRQGS